MNKEKRAKIAQKFNLDKKDLKDINKCVKKETKQLEALLNKGDKAFPIVVQAKWSIKASEIAQEDHILVLKILLHEIVSDSASYKEYRELPTAITNKNLLSDSSATNIHFIETCFKQAASTVAVKNVHHFHR